MAVCDEILYSNSLIFTANNPVHHSVKSCVRYLCRASARLQVIFLVLCTLLNCLDCIILWNCYKIKNKNHHTFYEIDDGSYLVLTYEIL